MAPTRSSFVLLLSRAPEEHVDTIQSFRRSGTRIRIATEPGRALELLRCAPALVLVDLAFGARLTPPVVEALNSGRRRSVVLGLHDGSLEHVQDAVELSVDGFCRAHDLATHARSASGAAFPASGLMH